jgi:hypothetical protein
MRDDKTPRKVITTIATLDADVISMETARSSI